MYVQCSVIVHVGVSYCTYCIAEGSVNGAVDRPVQRIHCGGEIARAPAEEWCGESWLITSDGDAAIDE
jgi:hypothetical protein